MFSSPANRKIKSDAIPENPKKVVKPKLKAQTKLDQNKQTGSDSTFTSIPNNERDQEEISDLAYSKFLSALFTDCLINKTLEKERFDIDLQMAALAKRFEDNIILLDKTNKRLQEISFSSEQQRILDLQENVITNLDSVEEKSEAHDILDNLTTKQASTQNSLDLHNVDFGYKDGEGYGEIMNALNSTMQGLQQIKSRSSLDFDKLKTFEEYKKSVSKLQNAYVGIQNMKKDLNVLCPQVNATLVDNISEKLKTTLNSDDEFE